MSKKTQSTITKIKNTNVTRRGTDSKTESSIQTFYSESSIQRAAESMIMTRQTSNIQPSMQRTTHRTSTTFVSADVQSSGHRTDPKTEISIQHFHSKI